MTLFALDIRLRIRAEMAKVAKVVDGSEQVASR